MKDDICVYDSSCSSGTSNFSKLLISILNCKKRVLFQKRRYVNKITLMDMIWAAIVEHISNFSKSFTSNRTARTVQQLLALIQNRLHVIKFARMGTKDGTCRYDSNGTTIADQQSSCRNCLALALAGTTRAIIPALPKSPRNLELSGRHLRVRLELEITVIWCNFLQLQARDRTARIFDPRILWVYLGKQYCP